MTPCLLLILSTALSLSTVSRPTFLGILQTALWNPLRQPSPPEQQDDAVLPLRWLPIAGCLAVSVLVEEQFRYLAVVDTGSPFLTAPPDMVAACGTKAEPRRYPPTTEQYGETAATITWQKARQVLVGGVQSLTPCRLGVVTDQLRADTGGLFCGLIWNDDARPTFLQQAQQSCFTVDYTARTLTLHSSLVLSAPFDRRDDDDDDALDMYDLSPFGPDLYHYAVEATTMTIVTNKGDFVLKDSTRPIVVVVDTGLTGCIFSDSFVNDGCLPVPISSIRGARLQIGSAKSSSTSPILLSSEDRYWNLACFRLPWFTDEQNHPHIVAVGATFLRDCKITVNAKQRRIRLSNLQS